MRVDEAYHLLDVPPSASEEEVRRAWRDMTKVWHPDRFAHDADLQRKAQEKLKDINAAYDAILAARAGRGGWRRESPRSEEPRSGPVWKVRSGGREWSAANLEMILGWAAAGRVPPDAEIFDPGPARWAPLDSFPEAREAFARSRVRRLRRWGLLLTTLGFFFLLRRPTLGGIILAGSFFAVAMILFWRTK